MAGCFPEKPRWCLSEQVCQESKVQSALSGPEDWILHYIRTCLSTWSGFANLNCQLFFILAVEQCHCIWCVCACVRARVCSSLSSDSDRHVGDAVQCDHAYSAVWCVYCVPHLWVCHYISWIFSRNYLRNTVMSSLPTGSFQEIYGLYSSQCLPGPEYNVCIKHWSCTVPVCLVSPSRISTLDLVAINRAGNTISSRRVPGNLYGCQGVTKSAVELTNV